jgi:hypothetical protein
MLNAGETSARPPITPAELRQQATRRTLRRIDTKVVVAVAAVAAVIVALIVVGPLRSSSAPPRSPVVNQPTTTTPTTTTAPTTTTTVPTIPAAAASQLDSYVAAEAATDSAAASRSGQPFPFVSDHSPPTVDGSDIIAVAAFSYDPGGHPVQVLHYSGGAWSEVAGLPGPSDPGTTATASSVFLTQGPVSVADVTGDGRPDFLIEAGGADNTPGFVVSQDGDGGMWRYIAFVGPYANTPTDIIARNPAFSGNTVTTDYNNCVPDCAGGTNTTIVWTYNRSTGEFTAPDPAGYPTTSPTTAPGS